MKLKSSGLYPELDKAMVYEMARVEDFFLEIIKNLQEQENNEG